MRYARLTLLCIILGPIASIALINHFFSGDRQFENLALGTQTHVYQARENGKYIHIQRISTDEEPMLVDNIRNRDVLFFLGNSQTHSINQPKENQVNFVELLNNKWGNDHLTVRAHSLPNASLEEFYLSYQYWKTKMHIKYLVVPVFMDDMREEGIRDVFFPKLIDEKYQLHDSVAATAQVVNSFLRANWPVNENSKTNDGGKANDDMAAIHETTQEKTETFLDHELDSNWGTWHNRQNVRGEFYNFMYKFRNTVFHISAQTVRKMMPQVYEHDLQALKDLASSCVKDSVKLLIYVPPIRSDVKLPYDLSEYALFKKQVKGVADAHPGQVFFANYDTVVPGNLWGFKEATSLSNQLEIDFMHFQYRGHEILAGCLNQSLTQMIELR